MKPGKPITRCAILADPRDDAMRNKLKPVVELVSSHLSNNKIDYDVFFGVHPNDITFSQPPDIFLVLGGDGTMIHFGGTLAHYNIPFFGINYGNMGFMLNSPRQGLETIVQDLAQGHYFAWTFPVLEVSAKDLNGGSHKGLGINDIYLQRMTAQTCKINVSINQKRLAFNPIFCDGIIVSTPLGSTAYSYNATGSVVSIDCPVLTITPLAANRTCPIKSLMVPFESVIDVEVCEPKKRRVQVVSDGQEQGDIRSAQIKLSPKSIKLSFNHFDDQFPMRFINKCRI